MEKIVYNNMTQFQIRISLSEKDLHDVQASSHRGNSLNAMVIDVKKITFWNIHRHDVKRVQEKRIKWHIVERFEQREMSLGIIDVC
jgi:hypothetical protein